MNELKSESYNYILDEKYIAKYPTEPKEEAKLLVYDRKTDSIIHSKFGNLLNFLPKNTAVLFNDTKVIKARIYGKKETGGKIELLLNQHLNNGIFSAYIRAKVHKNSLLFFEDNLTAKILELCDDGTREVEFYLNNKILQANEVYKIFDKIGHVPLPPYIKRLDEKEDEISYQSIFAKNLGAVAAPTASLHFSDKMLNELQKKHKTAFLTLHVGAGTFKPINVTNINEHKMHKEFFNIPQEAIELIESKTPLLSVGTTVARSVEYFVRTNKASGFCDLFLHPKNPPIRLNHLLTNFHLPKSTLIMLVASFVGLNKVLEIYEIAKKENYKFYSYGDGMLIL